MDGVDASAFANVFASNLIIILAGAVCAFLGMDRFFPRRSGKTWPFWIYFLVKCSLWAFYDAAVFFGISGSALSTAWVAVVALLSIVTYAILYITWESGILKLGLVAVLVDSVAGFAAVVVMAVSSVLLTGEMSLEYVGFIRPQTFVIAVFQIVVFLLLIWIASPVGRFICDFKFKRERLWTVVLMTVLVLVASTKTKGVDDSVAVYAMVAFLAILLVVPHVLWRGRMVRQQRMLLARTKALTRAYDDSLRNQVDFLAESRQLLDGLAARIETAGHDVNDKGVAEHLKTLRDSCDALRYGTYSDNPALDVMLVSWEGRFGALGVPTEYRIAPMAQGGAQAALVVQALFEWAFRECSDSSASKGKRGIVPDGLVLRVFRSANQLLIELRLAGWDGSRFPRSWVAERMPSQVLSVREFSADGQRVVRVIVEEEPAWKS